MEGTNVVKIYGIRQSRAMRCYWAAEELGIPHESVPIDFSGGTRKPEFLAINPNGHIPALMDGDLKLFESLAINLYLAKRYDTKGLYPKSAADEARAIQWSFWAITETEAPALQILMHTAVLPKESRNAKVVQDSVEKLKGPLGVLDVALAGRKHLLGDAFTIADLNVASVLSWLVVGRTDLSFAPNVARWLGECCQRPAFAKATGR
jgi:glutathione S-transferase